MLFHLHYSDLDFVSVVNSTRHRLSVSRVPDLDFASVPFPTRLRLSVSHILDLDLTFWI